MKLKLIFLALLICPLAFGQGVKQQWATTNTGPVVSNTVRRSVINEYKPSGSQGGNTFIGTNSGNLALFTNGTFWSGGYNTGVGASNLTALTYGGANTSLGALAMRETTTGGFNVGVGYQALSQNTSGSYNIGIGDSALDHNDSGIGNVGIGWQALVNNVAGSYNTSLGYGTMQSNLGTNTQENVAVGNLTMFSNITGIDNTVVGSEALYDNARADANTAVGFGAMQNRLSSWNTALGYFAGRTGTIGSNNVFLGYGAGYYETGNNKLFVDNATRASESNGRTNALIYGVFDPDPTVQTVAINGKLGIGNITPTVPVYVRGTAAGSAYEGLRIDNPGAGSGTAMRLGFSDTAGSENAASWVQGAFDGTGMTVQIGTGTAWAQGTERVRIDSAGAVGIGTNSPQTTLDVVGGIRAITNGVGTDLSKLSSVNDGADSIQLNLLNTGVKTNTASVIRFTSGLASGGSIAKIRGIVTDTNGSASGAIAFQTRLAGSASDRVYIAANGNVSVGAQNIIADSVPAMLDVQGDVRALTTITATNSFMLPTNYVAANFVPVAGMVKICASNGVLWKVTQLTTNLLSANTP